MKRLLGIVIPFFISLLAEVPVVEALPCVHPKLFPELTWKPLREGNRLREDDAVVTCEGASVRLQSSIPLRKFNKWREPGDRNTYEIPPEVFAKIRPREKDHPEMEVEVTQKIGRVFYSQDRDLIRQLGVGIFSSLTQEESKTDERRQRQLLEGMNAMPWDVLTVDQELSPWDMVWTQANGRVELEFLETGKDFRFNRLTTVWDSQGEPTMTHRYPPNSFLMLFPQHVQRATVNKIIGDVWVTTDHQKVKELFNRSLTPWSIRVPKGGDEALRKWKEMLKKEEME